MIDSFGYQVNSLDEVIDHLIEIRKRTPKYGNLPVWVDQLKLLCPVKGWRVSPNGVELVLETGA